MRNPRRYRNQIRVLVNEFNELVDQNERNALRQEQILRQLGRLGALDAPIPFSVVVRTGEQAAKQELSAKPDRGLS